MMSDTPLTRSSVAKKGFVLVAMSPILRTDEVQPPSLVNYLPRYLRRVLVVDVQPVPAAWLRGLIETVVKAGAFRIIQIYTSSKFLLLDIRAKLPIACSVSVQPNVHVL
jgi:hypothetical protein